MTKKIFFRAPVLARLGSRLSDSRKLSALHGVLRRYFPDVARVAVALYDAQIGTARTFLSHGNRPTPLTRYESRLDKAPALRRIFRRRSMRVVNDLDIFAKGRHAHTRAIRAGGFKSGAAFPLVVEDRVRGFVFFNSRRKNAFAPADWSGWRATAA